jgi:hypothetical protein
MLVLFLVPGQRPNAADRTVTTYHWGSYGCGEIEQA